ncbi:MAG: phosphatase PAP2 family protein [Bacteroidales bacterium]|nr:phosphatase PAP2 family protein [Bacteroidales bacterium]
MKFKQFLKSYFAFIIPYSLFLIVGIVLLLLYSKVDIHLYINKINSPVLDDVFKYATEFGAFVLIAPIIMIMALFKYRFALMAIAASVLASIFVQILKRVVWTDSPRPKVVFQDLYELHYVENVHLHSSHSFPSGHTAGAFALFIVLALINKRPVFQFLFLMMAVLVGYSRMYLSQHFLIDVVVGSLVGTVSAFACYFWLNNAKLREKNGLDQSILTSLKSLKH